MDNEQLLNYEIYQLRKRLSGILIVMILFMILYSIFFSVAAYEYVTAKLQSNKTEKQLMESLNKTENLFQRDGK